MHGGKAPQVQESAKDRIAALVNPAIDTLRRALTNRDIGAAVRAARDLLDRAGHGAPKTPLHLGVTLEELLTQSRAGDTTDHIFRLQSLTPQAILVECQAHHGGRCDSLNEHARAMAAERVAESGTATREELRPAAPATNPVTGENVVPKAVDVPRDTPSSVGTGSFDVLGADPQPPRGRPSFPYTQPQEAR